MRTFDYGLSHEPFEDFEVTDSDLVVYFHPREIVSDPELTIGRKRELLAHWASDSHAVAGAPALRSAAGVTVSIDDLYAALRSLDEMTDIAALSGTSASISA
jgi:hypothetical protein